MTNTRKPFPPKDGGAAFPTMIGHDLRLGMSLRDWFAGMAVMGGIVAPTYADAAQEAYLYADAMIAERNKSAT